MFGFPQVAVILKELKVICINYWLWFKSRADCVAQVLILWALTGQRLMSGLRLNVAFLKGNQWFIRCDSLWSPSLICEEKDKVSPLLDGLWFLKRHNSLCMGQMALLWQTAHSCLGRVQWRSCHMRGGVTADSVKKYLQSLRWGRMLYYVDVQDTHKELPLACGTC